MENLTIFIVFATLGIGLHWWLDTADEVSEHVTRLRIISLPVGVLWVIIWMSFHHYREKAQLADERHERSRGNMNEDSSRSWSRETHTEVSEDERIHAFMNEKGAEYETKFGIDKGDALIAIEASKKFQKSLIEVTRIYDTVQAMGKNESRTSADFDAANLHRFREIGFSETNGVWYYDGQEVNIGVPPSALVLKKSPAPEVGKEIEVSMKAEATSPDLGCLKFNCSTNLPDRTIMMIELTCTSINYSAQCKTFVREGRFESAIFRDGSQPNSLLRIGEYRLNISTPTAEVQEGAVKMVIGSEGRNMIGKHVRFDEVFGNQVSLNLPITFPLSQPKSERPQRPQSLSTGGLKVENGMITLESADGKSIQAKILALTKDTVVISRDTGEFEIPIARFSTKSQEKIEAYRTALRAK